MDRPLIGIGLVVRNGEDHLADAIESLRKQTCGDFELVIYDNASTDRTEEIARRFAQMDERISYVRHPRDVGLVANFVIALENASTPYFCWAACDDLREPAFLQTLLDLLQRNPEAGLAGCEVRNLDPDGTVRSLRRETRRMHPCADLNPGARLVAYLRETPCVLFYGLYRTEAAKEQIEVLKEMADPPEVIPLAGDVVFLAAVLGRHGIAMTREPLLLFRSGGASHRVDLHDSLPQFLGQLWRFMRRLNRVAGRTGEGIGWRLRIRLAMYRYFIRFLLSAPLRRMFMHHLARAVPAASRVHTAWAMKANPAFRRLKRRARTLPQGSRVVLFGAGKHTRRCFRPIESALSSRAIISGVCDDAADKHSPIGDLDITPTHAMGDLSPDLVLISSDAYEATLFGRAMEATPAGVPVWCIYDRSLETSAPEGSVRSIPPAAVSSSSTDSMKAAI